jgi:hypothetical protein
MILYHFTAREYLDSIRDGGITKGDVPLPRTEGRNGVWLASDKNPSGHGLSHRRAFTDEERKKYKQVFGQDVPEGAMFLNKRAIRIAVKIPRNDRSLVQWQKWGKKRLDPEWYETLAKSGGHKDKTWFIYFGRIPPDWFVAIDDLELE